MMNDADRDATRRRTTAGIALMLMLAAAGCADAEEVPDAVARAVEAPAEPCQVVERELSLGEGVGETSGIAESRRTPGVYWTHNDSGGQPVLFAVRADGSAAGQVTVTGAQLRDWEDLAAAPCDGGSCLLIGDIGDNAGRKRELTIWRIPEPVPGQGASAPAERFDAVLPGGAADVEALFALPDGRVFLISKGTRTKSIDLYRWPTPLRAGAAVTLEHVRRLAPAPEQPGDEVTGAGASPDGKWVAVRSYSTLAFFRTAELLAGGDPVVQIDLLPLGEPQGEGVSLSDDGTVMLTSEGGEKHLPGHAARLSCTLP